ncbi:MAG: tripartite tricarboxylate transporter substrate binding protein [Gammaproteobacteria bacterium]|nr:MAG: tripartite tricarboxylate transporter substrate binding protein [Gammaproteobacteria bacterium]
MTRIRTPGFLILGALLALGIGASAWAGAKPEKPKNYPLRPVALIVPYGNGGGSDQLSRTMALAAQQALGVGVLVVNRPGNTGRAAIPGFMKAPADGYTVIEHTDDVAAFYASGRIDVNPVKDWTPLAIAQITFSQIYIRAGEDRFTDWKSFLKYAKSKGGRVTVANVSGATSMERINMILLERELGFSTRQVSIDNPSERYGALVSGQVDALFEQPGDVRAFLDTRRMKPILTFLRKRPVVFGDVPSLKDVGARFTPLLRFRGFFARSDVPQDRLRYLEWAFAQAFNSAEFQAFNEKKFMNLIDSYRGTAGARQLVADQIAMFEKIYKQIGLTK